MVATFVVLAIFVIALGSVTDSLNKVIEFSNKYWFKIADRSQFHPTPDSIPLATQSIKQTTSGISTAPPSTKQLKQPLPMRKSFDHLETAPPLVKPTPQFMRDATKNDPENTFSNDATPPKTSEHSDRDPAHADDKSSMSIANQKEAPAKPDHSVANDSRTSDVSPPSTYCPNTDALADALNAARTSVVISERDRNYRRVIDNALCSFNFDIALRAAQGMTVSISKDDGYLAIIKAAIKQRNFRLATETADKITITSNHDSAIKLIVEAASAPTPRYYRAEDDR